MSPNSEAITEKWKLRHITLVCLGTIVVVRWAAFDKGIRPPWNIIATEFFGTFAVGIILGVVITHFFLKERLRDGLIMAIGDDLWRLLGLIFLIIIFLLPGILVFLCVAKEPKQFEVCLSMSHHPGYLSAGLLSGLLVWQFIWITLLEMAKSGDVVLEIHKVGWTKTKKFHWGLAGIFIISYAYMAFYYFSLYLE